LIRGDKRNSEQQYLQRYICDNGKISKDDIRAIDKPLEKMQRRERGSETTVQLSTNEPWISHGQHHLWLKDLGDEMRISQQEHQDKIKGIK